MEDTLVGLPIAPVEPTRKLDPNFYLANERVFLKWVRIALTWSTLAVLFISRSVYRWEDFFVGWFLLGLAVVISCYGMASHQLRSNAWRERTLFSDPLGITVVLGLIFVGVLVVAIVCGVFDEKVTLHRLALVNTH